MGVTGFGFACGGGKKEVVEFLWEKDKEIINQKDKVSIDYTNN